MRTRVRNPSTEDASLSGLTYKEIYEGVVTHGPVAAGSGSLRQTFELEEITDDPSPGRGVKYVKHEKFLRTNYLKGKTQEIESCDWGAPGPGASHKYCDGPGAWWWAFVNAEPGTLKRDSEGINGLNTISTWDNDVDQLVADTVHAFYSANDVDSLLNVIESPELVSSLSSLKTTLGNESVAKGLRDNMLSEAEVRNNPRLRRLRKLSNFKRGKIVSDLYLLWSFAISPLIADMNKVQRSIKSLKDKIEAANKSAGRLVSVHGSCKGNIVFKGDDEEAIGDVRDATQFSYRIVEKKLRRTCTVRGIRSVKYNSPALAQLAYLIDRFGLSGPATTAWELVPLSFVVDWFVDLRNVTDRLDNALTGGSKQIIDVCISEKVYAKTIGTIQSYGPYVINQAGSVMAESEWHLYTRNPVTDFNKVRFAGRFGKKQASLSAALIYSKVANLVRVR
jgi:hypothetical protein